MRLSEKYVPTTLDQIVGQPAVVRRLKHLVENPEACCLLFEGEPGIGKTATANALANDLGCCPWSGRHMIGAARLGVERIEELWEKRLRLRPMEGTPWHVLMVEELERCVSDGARSELKCRLGEGELLPRLIVVATSNDTSKLEPALLERFERLVFSSGPDFHAECMAYLLPTIWGGECHARGLGDLPLPGSWTMWGVEESMGRQRFSLRRAINAMGNALEVREVSRLRAQEAVA
jgi:DNA polymerase III delta prime subunit